MNHKYRSPKVCFHIVVLLWGFAAQVAFAEEPRSESERNHLDQIESLVLQSIDDGNMPGCVIAIGSHDSVDYLRAFGDRQLKPTQEEMTIDTVFDLASITKPVATAMSVMLLSQQGKIELDEPVASYWPEFAASGKQAVTIRDLLLHQGGLIADNSLRDYSDGPKIAMERVSKLKLVAAPKERFIYSDVGFIVLAEVVRRVSGSDVNDFSQQHVFRPLAMNQTGYLPGSELRQRAAPTEKRDGRWIRGDVHDPRAYAMGGIAGHAGLFSSANDLIRYGQMMLQRGTIDGTTILDRPTFDEMTRGYKVPRGIRGLGWDKQTGYSSNRANGMSKSAFGHGGFTGTVIWIDPELDLFYILLSSRLHPDGKGTVNRLAGKIGTLAVESLVGHAQHDNDQ